RHSGGVHAVLRSPVYEQAFGPGIHEESVDSALVVSVEPLEELLAYRRRQRAQEEPERTCAHVVGNHSAHARLEGSRANTELAAKRESHQRNRVTLEEVQDRFDRLLP